MNCQLSPPRDGSYPVCAASYCYCGGILPIARPWEVKDGLDLVTTDFVYVRWLGDRHGIEKITRVWDRTVVDRTEELRNWLETFKTMANKKIVKVFAYSILLVN